ncbi:MAG: hypothetical protein P8Y97_21700 [Candidatus Lokiarchaeota archaeon]
MDLQSYLGEKIDDVKFIEIYEKMPSPQTEAASDESIKKKIEEFNEEEGEENSDPELKPSNKN